MKNTLHLRSPAKQKNSLQRIIDKWRIVAVAGRAIASQFFYSIYHKRAIACAFTAVPIAHPTNLS
ncbi:MAG: hypothetical protein JGK17_20550 [Microcoleus sp. PH2017_10_PVI_O_A]|uniref:hypothetical protein n=1 Tax=unclassified Microcoleus TaxID=2642155 RepID=UPI001DAA2E10|nr:MULTISPECIES: hypothetical protein [unclassified Microcoleus]MCC3407935.1 hypothetical protein [Microcoleus sp. PH2017_10_PVI_O_A]MCC3462071.1 hypothetical protein [Microcoleus sp. PH2017_11_PCY_U_A]MCC3480539.1 hypothetical protein [Microcoleus sp. PH2017_12_PCY_D_A]MCC3530375.1 hypothetical protein [Microcoleus sp. PH2017_21_RUC_O_A]MCC3542783.1 hypothetical protein [Microcoleus sp. PH2017_22_RUC_O_B]